MKKFLITLFLVSSLTLSLSGQIAPALQDANENADGSYTNWFGTFTPEGALSNEGWINHAEHGRLYIVASGEDLWAYDPNVAALGEAFHGWIYSSRSLFPFFYVESNPGLYLLYVPGAEGPAATPRAFFNAATFDQLFLSKANPGTVVDIAISNTAFSSLVTAVSTANLVETLSSDGPFTVFAPTDEAFAKLDPDTLNDLLTNPDSLPTLTGILTYHVVAGRVTSDMLGLDLGSILRGEVLNGYVETVNGAPLKVDTTPFGILLNGTTMVTAADIEGSNGVIHVIDSVLLPPADIVDTAIAAEFNTLVTAVTEADLVDTLRMEGPYTVFAPTDTAFGNLPDGLLTSLLNDIPTLRDILLYHVFPGDVYASEVAPGEITMANGDTATLSINEEGELMIDGAKIIATDVVTSNGVIHIIDAVITPPEG